MVEYLLIGFLTLVGLAVAALVIVMWRRQQ